MRWCESKLNGRNRESTGAVSHPSWRQRKYLSGGSGGRQRGARILQKVLWSGRSWAGVTIVRLRSAFSTPNTTGGSFSVVRKVSLYPREPNHGSEGGEGNS